MTHFIGSCSYEWSPFYNIQHIFSSETQIETQFYYLFANLDREDTCM